jgi:hypothetical protein
MILSGLHKFKNDLSDSIVFVNEDFELVVDGFIGYPRGRPTDSVSELAYRLTKTVSFSPGSRRIKFNALFFPTLVFWVGHALIFRTMYTRLQSGHSHAHMQH